jgi:orotate phosphoribosyltransferase
VFRKIIAQKLLEVKAVKLSPSDPFTWASGIKSPIYCDNRITLSFPNVRDLIIKGFVKESVNFGDFDIVGGIATAGIPHGALLADRLNKPFIYVRDKPKGHGRQNQIEGNIKAGDRVLLIEDLISTGGSSLKSVEAIREVGANVVGVLAIFSYNFDEAGNAFSDANCKLITLSDYDILIMEAIKEKYISIEHQNTLVEWRKNPKTWVAD